MRRDLFEIEIDEEVYLEAQKLADARNISVEELIILALEELISSRKPDIESEDSSLS